MDVETAQILVTWSYGYLALGTGFALWFVVGGAARLDPKASAGTRGFRVLVFPGAVALWPVLAAKLLRGART